jgi:hypothetical protein
MQFRNNYIRYSYYNRYMTNSTTSKCIAVKLDTYSKLSSLGNKNDSFDNIIQRLLVNAGNQELKN